MGLLRNKEVKIFLLAVLLIGISGAVFCAFISPVAAAVAGISSLSMISAFFIFTNWRYRQLIRLNDCLKQVNGGDYSLELEDNSEGELSILKSEIYKATLMLREQNDLLIKEKAFLANALSDISHQLKTPLTSMFVMTDLLCDGQLAEEDRIAFTGRIRTQLERLQWLVESLLKLSRLDAKAVPFRCENVRYGDLIQKACEPLLIPAELKDQTLSVKKADVSLVCDLNWTAEALVNILKNCVEHTPPGGTIHISAFANPLYTQITVEDNGPGIAGADLPYIFNRFYKGKNAGEDSVGIGLAMSKSITEAQGGSLEARSSPGGGAVFIMRFPGNLPD